MPGIKDRQITSINKIIQEIYDEVTKAVRVTGDISVSIETSDIEIGAVEVKNSNTDDRLKINPNGSADVNVVAATTISAPLGSIQSNTDNLDVLLSTRASEVTLALISSQVDVALSTRASEATLASVLAQLDVALSTRSSETTAASILAQLNVALSTRASEVTLNSILTQLDVALSTRSSEVTVASILAQLDVDLSTRASETTLASVLTQLDVALSTRASEVTLAAILAQLDVDLSTRASEVTLASVLGRLDVNLSTRAAEHVLATDPHSVRLTDGSAFYDSRQIRTLTSADQVDISDRAARDMGKIDIAGFDVPLPIGDNRIGQVKITDDTTVATVHAVLAALKTAEAEEQTFVAYADNVAIAQNKSMISLVNAGGSTVNLRVKAIYIINSRTTAVTGVVADFQLLRITGHSVGTLLTPSAYDTADVLNSSITVRTGSTVAGENAAILRRWLWSSDEWGTGTLDVEAQEHSVQNLIAAYTPGLKEKPITLRAGEGLTLKQITNSANGTFDVMVIFTQV